MPLTSLFFGQRLPTRARTKLSQIYDDFSEKRICDIHLHQIEGAIWIVHDIITQWSGRAYIADAMLQTVGIDVTNIQISEGRAMEDSCSHIDRYDDQREHGPRSSPEAAVVGLTYIVGTLLQSENKTPEEMLCTLIDQRWTRETRIRSQLYIIRDRLLHQKHEPRQQGALPLVADTSVFTTLTWS